MSIKELTTKGLAMGRLSTFIIIASVLAISTAGAEHVGLSSEQVNSQYRFSVGTSVQALVLSPLLLAFLYLHRPVGRRETTGTIVPLWRRFTAFMIDTMTAALPVSAILALPVVLIEKYHTGLMAWQFTRDFPRSTDDLLAIGGVIVLFLWVIFYFSYPLTKGDQTIGQYILGYRIAKEGQPLIPYKTAIIRVIVSFLVMCAGWITIPFAFFDSKKYMFHDSEDGFRPELVTYKR